MRSGNRAAEVGPGQAAAAARDRRDYSAAEVHDFVIETSATDFPLRTSCDNAGAAAARCEVIGGLCWLETVAPWPYSISPRWAISTICADAPKGEFAAPFERRAFAATGLIAGSMGLMSIGLGLGAGPACVGCG
jgi:hypothetical protein